jgi:hypothetical protein
MSFVEVIVVSYLFADISQVLLMMSERFGNPLIKLLV